MLKSKKTNSGDHQGYLKETAGRIMVSTVPIVLESFTIGEAESVIMEKINEFETINYLYAVDKKNRLKGVVSIKEVFHQPKDIKISEVMRREVIAARSHTDQERVVSLALKHSLKAVPVVDKNKVFLGVVTSDVILKVLQLEHEEDVLQAAGVLEVNLASGIIKANTKRILFARLPWLLFGLLGGIVAAVIMSRFEELMTEHIILALFVPVMVYMSDAVRSQTQTIFIRAMALDRKFLMGKYFTKEIFVGLFLSAILAVLLGVIVGVWFKTFSFALIISISMFVTVFMAVIIALIVPIGFLIIKKDTAVGSGPFSTIISDVLSIVIYFTVAYLLLELLGA